MVWRVVAPPTLPRVFAPRAAVGTEHVATHDRRAKILERLAQHVIVDSRFAAACVAVQRAKSFRGNRPVVKMERAFAKRIFHALVRPGDVAVERHRDVESEFAHRRHGQQAQHRLTMTVSRPPSARSSTAVLDAPLCWASRSYSSWRWNQISVPLRPSGARSSHWYMPQSVSSPRAYAE